MSNTTIFAFTDLYLSSGTRINVKSKKNNLVSVYSNTVTLEPAPANSYITFSSPTSFTFRLQKTPGLSGWNGAIEYSTDRYFWNRYESGTTITSVLQGNTYNIYLRGSGNTYVGITAAGVSGKILSLEGENISCTGNIETLLDYTTVLNGNHPNMDNCCFQCLFYNNENLITAPELPATTLTAHCYREMFYDCFALTSVPTLPAMTLADYCYYKMFAGCTSLTTAPALNATTLVSYCYDGMFSRCISLTTAPNLPATTLADNCYNGMFQGCTSLTTPAKMADGTIQVTPAKLCCTTMYSGCTSLNIYTSASGHTAFYKALTYSTGSSATDYRSTYQMFYNCYIDGVQSTDDYLTAGTQYYY